MWRRNFTVVFTIFGEGTNYSLFSLLKAPTTHWKAAFKDFFLTCLLLMIKSVSEYCENYDECLLPPLLYARHCWAASLVTSHLPTQHTIYKSLLPHSAAIPHTNTCKHISHTNADELLKHLCPLCTLHCDSAHHRHLPKTVRMQLSKVDKTIIFLIANN